MPKFALKVLCKDGDTCNFVKGTLMEDFTIEEAKITDDFDHIGILNFKSLEDAKIKAVNLMNSNPSEILDIYVSPR